MGISLRRVVLMIGAPAVLLLAIDKIGGSPITPGYSSGFAWSTASFGSSESVKLTKDVGDQICLLRLRISPSVLPVDAHLTDNTVLAATKDDTDSSGQWFFVSKKSNNAKEKFMWPSGVDIILSPRDTNLSGIRLEDWVVYLSDKDFDSLSRARWRSDWRKIWLALLVFSLIGAVYGAIPEPKEEKPFTSQVCIEFLILSIEGSTKEETKRMQSLLQKVLLKRVPAANALESLSLPRQQSRALWFKAAGAFRASLESLTIELYTYLSKV
jgi:hypothetical protein